MKKALRNAITGAIAAASLMVGAGSAASYSFTVACPDSAQVIEWEVSDIDPGKAFLRASTGMQYPGCSVNEYQIQDAALPRFRHSPQETLLTVVPLIGSIINGFIDRH